jgi:hypothetical protein
MPFSAYVCAIEEALGTETLWLNIANFLGVVTNTDDNEFEVSRKSARPSRLRLQEGKHNGHPLIRIPVLRGRQKTLSRTGTFRW